MTDLATIFQEIADLPDRKWVAPGSQAIEHDGACGALQDLLCATILPRRITIKSGAGPQISLVAKNRRIVKLADVHPPTLWDDESSPQDTVCSADYESFGQSFATTLVKLIGDTSVHIEQNLIADPLGKLGTGYPASLIGEHVELSQQRPSADKEIIAFHEHFQGLSRARFGTKTICETADGSSVTDEQLEDYVAAARREVSAVAADLRFVLLDGPSPLALAIAWLDGAGCIVVSETPSEFDDLAQRLAALRQYL